MNEDKTKYPYEVTVPVNYYSETEATTPANYPYLNEPYNLAPMPPPPPKQKRPYTLIIFVCIAMIILGALAVDISLRVKNSGSDATRQITTTSPVVETQTSIPQNTSTIRPTPSQIQPITINVKGDFRAFLDAFVADVAQQDYENVGATVQPGFLLYCNDPLNSLCLETWNATSLLLQQGALQFSFTQPVPVFQARTQCFVSGYGEASEIINAIYTQNGSIQSVAPSGSAQLVFVDENVGNNTFEWFWMTAVLNAAC